MKNVLKVASAIFLGLFILTGCGVATVYNVKNNPVTSEKKLTKQDMYKAIYAAGATLGWKITKVKDGLAQGQLNLRKHMALVDISYNEKDYSITYNNSLNLNYDKEKGTIHNNYNGWILNLQKAINTQIQLLSM
ncbi:hypothetical protein [Arcobacter sp.]|uniref:hypothetical protein n=1 Tax=Arcobacter sp. TaxID=1872629 RepID=UPI003D0D6C3F